MIWQNKQILTFRLLKVINRTNFVFFLNATKATEKNYKIKILDIKSLFKIARKNIVVNTLLQMRDRGMHKEMCVDSVENPKAIFHSEIKGNKDFLL